jgi:hypothetical protein
MEKGINRSIIILPFQDAISKFQRFLFFAVNSARAKKTGISDLLRNNRKTEYLESG